MSVQMVSSNVCLNPNATLHIDQACLSLVNQSNSTLAFYYIASECFQCKELLRAKLAPGSNTTLEIPTKYPLSMYYKNTHNASNVCHTTFTFTEYGNYGWNFSGDSCSQIYTLNELFDPYLPILAAFMIYILLASVYVTSKILYPILREHVLRSAVNIHDDFPILQETDSSMQPIIGTTRASTRIRSVDTFRGITVLLMIFVNHGGGKYVFFNHSAWYGLTVADLVFPWFTWIMGFTITISKRAELRVSNSRGKLILRCMQRAMNLIYLGLFINSIALSNMQNKALRYFRIPGVLQLLGVTYFICAVIETIFMKAHVQFGRFSILRDILDSWIQWLIVLTILVIHTCVTFFLPVPNCPKGYFGPGGYAQAGKYTNCTGGAAGYIDRLVFRDHMYQHTKNPVYGTVLPHDPEGLMNTISAVLIVYMGVHAGKILLLYYQYNSRMIRWILWSAATGITAGLLCNFEKEGGIIPISKKMMSLSFLLTASSFAFLLYSVLYLLIDYKQYWNGAPFIYAGMNPLFLYIGHAITINLFPWDWMLTEESTHAMFLTMNLCATTFWAVVAYRLYKKDFILTV